MYNGNIIIILFYLQAVEKRAFVYLYIETVEVAFFVTGLETL
jgi:hypothetical protein